MADLRTCAGACELSVTLTAWENERADLLAALQQEREDATRYRRLRPRLIVGEVKALARYPADETEGYNRAIDYAVDTALAEPQA